MSKSPSGLVANWISPAWSSFRRLLGVVRADRGLFLVVLALLLIDLFWIVYFGVGRSLLEMDGDRTLYNHKELLITTDGGVPEWFNYLKTVFLVILLVRLARTTRQPIYYTLVFVYLFVVFDDALEIHEAFGRDFVRWLEIPRKVYGLRANDIGEVITWAILGLLVVPVTLYTLSRSRPPHRGNGLAILLAFGALLFCAVFVDQLYSNFKDVFLLAGVMIDVIEDGGEMLAITLACALSLGALREGNPSRGLQAGPDA